MKTITILKPIKIIADKTTFSAVVFFLFVGMLTNTVLGIGDSAQGAVINAASCSYADVSAAVDSASAGDTVIVPAGDCTWDSRLIIEKGINLIGAGIDNTTITHNTGYFWTIYYQNAPNDEYLRISGFTFNMNDAGAIYLKPSSEPTVATVRIDHNRFTNSSYSGSCVMNFGSFGVIDNNVIDDVKYPFRTHSEGQSTWYAYDDDFLGTSLNMYIEDNVIDFGNQPTDMPVIDGDFGSRWAIRYNTIIAQGYHWSFTDLHGGRGRFEGGMGAEFYGNYIHTNGHAIHMVKQGGGRVISHHNNATEADGDVIVKLAENGYPEVEPISRQLMNNTYYFQNRENTTGILVRDYIIRNNYNTIIENETYWMDNESCIGDCSSISSGIGCGSSLPVQCTPSSDTSLGSTAFWLTDQSCTDLTGLTGAYTEVSGGNRDPSSIIEGTLYVCTATDTWTAWYTPYTYPHPLRGESGPGAIHPTRSNPDNFTLQQNYPNPFNPSTTIEYSVAKPCNVRIIIYNQLGQEIYTLVNESKPAGEYNVRWDGRDAKGNELASGVYFYRLTAGKQVGTKKMFYLR